MKDEAKYEKYVLKDKVRLNHLIRLKDTVQLQRYHLADQASITEAYNTTVSDAKTVKKELEAMKTAAAAKIATALKDNQDNKEFQKNLRLVKSMSEPTLDRKNDFIKGHETISATILTDRKRDREQAIKEEVTPMKFATKLGDTIHNVVQAIHPLATADAKTNTYAKLTKEDFSQLNEALILEILHPIHQIKLISRQAAMKIKRESLTNANLIDREPLLPKFRENNRLIDRWEQALHNRLNKRSYTSMFKFGITPLEILMVHKDISTCFKLTLRASLEILI